LGLPPERAINELRKGAAPTTGMSSGRRAPLLALSLKA
jgi:hypothetical protein